MNNWINIVNEAFAFKEDSLTTAFTSCHKGTALSINLAHVSRVAHENGKSYIFGINDRLIASCEEKTFIEAAKNATAIPM